MDTGSVAAWMSENNNALHELQDKVEVLLRDQAVMKERMASWEERFALRIDFEKGMAKLTESISLLVQTTEHQTRKTDEIDKSVKGVLAAFEAKIQKDADAQSVWSVMQKAAAIFGLILTTAGVFALASGILHFGAAIPK